LGAPASVAAQAPADGQASAAAQAPAGKVGDLAPSGGEQSAGVKQRRDNSLPERTLRSNTNAYLGLPCS
jgi:hypothetical protein